MPTASAATGLAAFEQTPDGFSVPVGELDQVTARALVDVLSTATDTPGDVFVGVWEGWGDVSVAEFGDAARIDTHARGHFLLRGPLVGVLDSISFSGMPRITAGLWWPRDRAWFVATEIDFPWTFVAGRTALIDALVEDPRLEVIDTSFESEANDPPAGRLGSR